MKQAIVLLSNGKHSHTRQSLEAQFKKGVISKDNENFTYFMVSVNESDSVKVAEEKAIHSERFHSQRRFGRRAIFVTFIYGERSQTEYTCKHCGCIYEILSFPGDKKEVTIMGECSDKVCIDHRKN